MLKQGADIRTCDQSDRRVALPALLAVALPALPISMLTLPLVVFLPQHFVAAFGMDMATVGFVFMVVRFLDLAFDPVAGHMMDRTRGRFGRFRPWLAAAIPLTLWSVSLLFLSTGRPAMVTIVVALLALYAAYSIVSLAQLGLGARLTSDYDERSRVYGWCQQVHVLGIAGAMMLPMLAGAEAGTGGILKAMGWFVIVATPLTCLPALLRRTGDEGPREGERSPKIAWKVLTRPTIVRILIIDLLLGIGPGLSSASAIYFIQSAKGLPISATTPLFMGYFIAAIATTPLWVKLARRWGKPRTLMVSSGLYTIAVAAAAITPYGDLWSFVAEQAAAGCCFGGFAVLPRSMMADAADEERLLSGEDRTGFLYAWITSVAKIGHALAIGIVFVVLDCAGFDAKAAAAGDEQLLALTMLYAGAPALLGLAAVWAVRGYPLTADDHARIVVALEHRDRQRARPEVSA